MDDLDKEEQAHVAANIAWLETAGPDDWHRVALDFNWGEPLYVLDWIARQADCDMATALTIFWKGEPSCWLEDDGSSPEEPNGFSYLNKKICAYIAHRVGSGGYTRSKIAYAPDVWMKQNYDELVAMETSFAKTNFRTHPDLIRTRRGRKIVNDQNFYRRYPEEFRHSFDCVSPGYNLQSIALMARVKLVEIRTMLRRFSSSPRT